MHKPCASTDPAHKPHNAPGKYPTMHHFVTEMCTSVHISVTKRCNVGYGTGALCDIRIRSILDAFIINAPQHGSQRTSLCSIHANGSFRRHQVKRLADVLPSNKSEKHYRQFSLAVWHIFPFDDLSEKSEMYYGKGLTVFRHVWQTFQEDDSYTKIRGPSYGKISWSLEAWRVVVHIIIALWNLTGVGHWTAIG